MNRELLRREYAKLAPLTAKSLRSGDVIVAPNGGIWRVRHITQTGRISAEPLDDRLCPTGESVPVPSTRIDRQYREVVRPAKKRGMGTHADKGQRYTDVRVPVVFRRLTPAMMEMMAPKAEKTRTAHRNSRSGTSSRHDPFREWQESHLVRTCPGCLRSLTADEKSHMLVHRRPGGSEICRGSGERGT